MIQRQITEKLHFIKVTRVSSLKDTVQRIKRQPMVEKCFANAHENKADVAILILDKVGFGTGNITRDKKDIS